MSIPLMSNDYQKWTATTELSDRAYRVASIQRGYEPLRRRLENAMRAGLRVEESKKLVFHGKTVDCDEIRRAEQVGLAMFSQGSIKNTHYLAGIVGEMAEIIEAAVIGEQSDVLEEVGDLLYYTARLLAFNGLTFEQAFAHNRAKLTARHGNRSADSEA